MSNKLLLPSNLICGYFDSAAFGTIKETPKRTCTMFEIEYFLEEGKNIFLNGNAYHVKKNRVHICSPGDVRNSEFWCKGYYVDTTGKNTVAIKEHIANQLKQDKESDQLSLFDPRDQFTGSR